MKTANLAILFAELGPTSPAAGGGARGPFPLPAPLRAFGGRALGAPTGCLLATFTSPTQAVLCALAIQDGLPPHQPVRIGVSAGEVRQERGTATGEPVDIAVRLATDAPGAGVFFSEAVYLTMDKVRVPSRRVGTLALAGLPRELRVYLALPPPASTPARPRARARPRLLAGALLVLLALAAALWPREDDAALEAAVDAVAQAPAPERALRAQQLQEPIARREPATRAWLRARLHEALGAPLLAVPEYQSSARAGHRPAAGRLMALLMHSGCRTRAAAARALGELALPEAREPLRRLAEQGPRGSADACGSRVVARQALRTLG